MRGIDCLYKSGGNERDLTAVGSAGVPRTESQRGREGSGFLGVEMFYAYYYHHFNCLSGGQRASGPPSQKRSEVANVSLNTDKGGGLENPLSLARQTDSTLGSVSRCRSASYQSSHRLILSDCECLLGGAAHFNRASTNQ